MAEAIRVAVRVRPFNQREKDLGSTVCVSMQGTSTTVQAQPQPKTFTYDFSYWSFSENDPNFANQDAVFADIGTVILENALKGFNGCLFAYGQTGAGKSYSVMGFGDWASKDASLGIIPRACESIFEMRDGIQNKQQGEAEEVRVWVSYVEIYNEQVRDLLYPSNEVVEMKVCDHPEFGVYIPGLHESPCESPDDAQKVMDFGQKKRVIASTNMNATSSRSHAVFTVKVERLTGAKPAEGKKDERKKLSAKINLVDLAGSERVSKTGAEGSTLKEGCAINQSLSALGMVIKELSEAMAKRPAPKKGAKDQKQNKELVPFRASKLTFLLKDSLAGNSKTYMIAALSPASDNLEETISTLRFASSVKKIKTVAKANVDKKDEMIATLQAEIKKMKASIGKGGGATVDLETSEAIAERESLLDSKTKKYEEQLADAKMHEQLRDEAMKEVGMAESK